MSLIHCYKVCRPASLYSIDQGRAKFKAKTSSSSKGKNQIERNLTLKSRLRNRIRKPDVNRNVKWKPPRPHPSLKKGKERDIGLSNEIVNELKGHLKQKPPSIDEKSKTKAPVGWMTVDTFKIGPPSTVPGIRGFSTQSFDFLSTKSTTTKPVTMAPYQGTPSPPFAADGDDRLWHLSGSPIKSKASISLNIRPWKDWTRDQFDFGIPIVNPFASVRNMATRAADVIKKAVLQFRHKVWTS